MIRKYSSRKPTRIDVARKPGRGVVTTLTFAPPPGIPTTVPSASDSTRIYTNRILRKLDEQPHDIASATMCLMESLISGYHNKDVDLELVKQSIMTHASRKPVGIWFSRSAQDNIVTTVRYQ